MDYCNDSETMELLEISEERVYEGVQILEKPQTWMTGESNFCAFCNPVAEIK